jgi:hypothetical protein
MHATRNPKLNVFYVKKLQQGDGGPAHSLSSVIHIIMFLTKEKIKDVRIKDYKEYKDLRISFMICLKRPCCWASQSSKPSIDYNSIESIVIILYKYLSDYNNIIHYSMLWWYCYSTVLHYWPKNLHHHNVYSCSSFNITKISNFC